MPAADSRAEQRLLARKLREVDGYSLQKISDGTKIARSTLHDWARIDGWTKPDKPVRRRQRVVRAQDKGGSGEAVTRGLAASALAPCGETAPADAAAAPPSGPADASSTAAIDALPAVPADARVTDILGGLIKSHMRAMFAEAPGGRFEKSQVDALWAMIRVAEWVDGQNRQEEEQAARDDELADLIERLNGRVVELARHFAGELAGGHDFTG